MYAGGCQDNNGSKQFANDKYVILYNNSAFEADLSKICLGTINPYNSNIDNNRDYVNGELRYKNENWIPAGTGFWFFQNNVKLAPWGQIVININGAINNTITYTNSINFANKDYYCCYDIEIFSNTSLYPAPASEIPTLHYLKAVRLPLAKGNAWTFSQISPAFYIFTPLTMSIADFNVDTNSDDEYSDGQARKKVPVDWIVDGIEVFKAGATNNKKRLTDAVDAGYIEHTNAFGRTLYRNVDAQATKAIAGNEAKLVYGYSKDPSGIDAEASIKNGARIVYKDTNNSTNDFHEREKASIKE